MVKVSIEIRDGSAHFNVAVRAQSIQQAANVVRVGYPDCGVRVRFPIDPEGFFVNEPAPRAGIVGIDRPALLAASGRWGACLLTHFHALAPTDLLEGQGR